MTTKKTAWALAALLALAGTACRQSLSSTAPQSKTGIVDEEKSLKAQTEAEAALAAAKRAERDAERNEIEIKESLRKEEEKKIYVETHDLNPMMFYSANAPLPSPKPIPLPEPEPVEIFDEGPIRPPVKDTISNTEEYGKIVDNPFVQTQQEAISTFSIDVDNAAYSNIRRMLGNGQLPPPDAVRIEEMINYFDYDYPQPTNKDPFSITTELAPAPWQPDHQLVHIGIQGKNLDYDHIKPSNLVFLIDVSGSMSSENKLPLVKESLKILMRQLDDKDKIAMVVYAGAAGLVLPATRASDTTTIIAALDRLSAGGSTAGGEGIRLAYQVAQENFIEGGNNRVILASDGDFNVGIYNTDELVAYMQEKRKTGIYMTICGYGMGNYKDDRLEQISNKGNGNYFYIDNRAEAQKVFEREVLANMFTLSKDVKIQITFDPQFVQSYRLIGYENRKLNKEDFNDDTKDAGELGAGHSVTAIYEVVPANRDKARGKWMQVNFRYKPTDSETSILIEHPLAVTALPKDYTTASENFRFSAAVAGWGMLLRNSPHKGNLTYPALLQLAQNAIGKDPHQDRNEMIQLIQTAQRLTK